MKLFNNLGKWAVAKAHSVVNTLGIVSRSVTGFLPRSIVRTLTAGAAACGVVGFLWTAHFTTTVSSAPVVVKMAAVEIDNTVVAVGVHVESINHIAGDMMSASEACAQATTNFPDTSILYTNVQTPFNSALSWVIGAMAVLIVIGWILKIMRRK